MANQLPNVFTDTRNVSKSYISAENIISRVVVLEKQIDDNIINEPQVQLKKMVPADSKDKNLPKMERKIQKNILKNVWKT